jgi:type I restriction-modification system DNA methylase subunit
MAINQAEIFTNLEKLNKNLDKNEFIYDFLSCYGYAPATITLLKKGDRNIAVNPKSGEVALKNGVYFKPLMVGEDIYEMATRLISLASNKTNKIRFVIVTDFVDVIAHDLKSNDPPLDCSLASLHDNYSYFLPLSGYEKARGYDESPADVKAAEQMGRLFDLIREKNKSETPEAIHALNVFLTRLLFCFFAEDTGIFEKNQMTKAIDSVTNSDGSDVSTFLENLFEVLNEPDESQSRVSKAAHFKSFPYVNGGLFKTKFPIPEFTSKARRILIDCGTMQWENINPDIFGSMFQSVIDVKQRGNLGQHYTSVTNIMKVIQPLFLDKLHEDLEKSRGSSDKLKAFIDRLSKIKVFDPACGSGNFLIIAYKELRKIEMAAFKALDELSSQKVMFMSGISLSQFYGIEIDDFAHEIALLSLWLTEHQMNQAFQIEFGYSRPALPLKESGNIFHANSLTIDWDRVCPNDKSEIFICGNPPFRGKKEQTKEQKYEIQTIFHESEQSGIIDYVACWFYLASCYSKNNSRIETALVATNSIIQGEQVAPIWTELLKFGMHINFAHQTFSWTSAARGKAGVSVVVIGFSSNENRNKKLYTYTSSGKQLVKSVDIINPYLVEASIVLIGNRSKPLCNAPKMVEGITPLDNGILSFSEGEYAEFDKKEPNSAKWIKPWVTGDSFINSYKSYCLWLVGISETELNELPYVCALVDKVRQFREQSKSSQKFSATPWLFRETQIPKRLLVIPKTSSERRHYVPIGYIEDSIVSSSCLYIEGSLYHLGILTSKISMDWLKAVGGKLESRYRYSSKLVYNNFVWPTPSENQRKSIETLAGNILLTRERYPEKTLALLYDPDLMPEDLLAAHQDLDLAVDKLYRDRPFRDSSDRLEHLFQLYEKLASNSDPQNMKIGSTEDLW